MDKPGILDNNQTHSSCGLGAHSLRSKNMQTVEVTSRAIFRRCNECGFEESLPRSNRSIAFINPALIHQKRNAHDQLAKEMLQPTNPDGSVNEEFTEAYGYNPFDNRTKHKTPKTMGGLKE